MRTGTCVPQAELVDRWRDPASTIGRGSFRVTIAVLLLVMFGTLGAFYGGPMLGDHEAIVAECARHMRLSGDWVVPVFMDTPFIRKSPLPYWLVAASSYVFPPDQVTGLPVTAAAARLPSALAGFITVLLLWRLGSSMFGRRVGIVAAVLAGSSFAFLLYSPNATAEMLLTFGCTWSYVHFWYGVTARQPGRRFVHMMLFYVAMGVAMLAKGPSPIALVAIPLAFWWYAEKPLRVLARQGLSGWPRASALILRTLVRRTGQVFTRLWLLPGLIVFGLIFIPWMFAVAERQPDAWSMWNWQYLQRALGNFEDTRPRGFFYYIPVVAGLLMPWLFLVIEAVAAPWLKRYARWHRPLLFVGVWAFVGILVMSSMTFKKPYYILPAVPGLLLLVSIVADQFYARSAGLAESARDVGAGRSRQSSVFADPLRVAWTLWAVLGLALVALVVGGSIWCARERPQFLGEAIFIGSGFTVLLLVAGVLYIRGRGWFALGLTAMTWIMMFHAVWYLCAPALENVRPTAALAQALDDIGAPRDAGVYWVDRMPDARLSFYYQRYSTQMVKPGSITSLTVDRTAPGAMLAVLERVVERAKELLASDEPVYLLVKRRHYNVIAPELGDLGRQITEVMDKPHPSGGDRLVVTNAAGFALARPIGIRRHSLLWCRPSGL